LQRLTGEKMAHFKSIALIAGDGRLPQEIARRLTFKGCPPVIYSFGEHGEDLSKFALELVKLSSLNLAFIVDDMQRKGVHEIIMAGLVPKTLMYHQKLHDEELDKLLRSLHSRDDHNLLANIVLALESKGFNVIGYKDIIPDWLASEGHFAGRLPTREELEDIKYGKKIAKVLLPLSFGQTLVVHKKAIVAVEAMEGTDAMLLRAGSLTRGGIVLKMMRPDQDERYDLPTVGVRTLQNMLDAGLKCLAVEVGRTVIIEPEDFKSFAADSGIAVLGVRH